MEEILGMPLFPHLYAIPLSVLVGVAIGYMLRGKVGDPQELENTTLPRKPQI